MRNRCPDEGPIRQVDRAGGLWKSYRDGEARLTPDTDLIARRRRTRKITDGPESERPFYGSRWRRVHSHPKAELY
jgi:hypothetical protein